MARPPFEETEQHSHLHGLPIIKFSKSCQCGLSLKGIVAIEVTGKLLGRPEAESFRSS